MLILNLVKLSDQFNKFALEYIFLSCVKRNNQIMTITLFDLFKQIVVWNLH